MWGKLYNIDLVKNVLITKLIYGEDLCFNLHVLLKTNKIVSIPENVYFYVYGGVTTNLNDNRIFEDAIKQYNYKISEFIKYKKLNFAEWQILSYVIIF